MARIYCKTNSSHIYNQGAVLFINGAAAASSEENLSYFAENDDSYEINYSKNSLELWDKFTIEELDKMYVYLGGTVDNDDTKMAKVRKIESSLSEKYLGSLTITSTAGTETGDTKITITNPGTDIYYAKTAKTTAATLLYNDIPDSSWTKLTLTEGEAELTPSSNDHDKVTVVKVNSDGLVVALASENLTVKS